MFSQAHQTKTLDQVKIKINEIFCSIQGESNLAGWPTVFVRTTGCNIRCNYCDTKYSYYEGQKLAVPEIIDRVDSYHVKHVCVTGGEPLAQTNTKLLLKELCDKGYVTSLETNGFFDTSEVDERVVKVIDIKTPGSGEGQSFNFDNLHTLSQKDQLKFVICSEDDFQWAQALVMKQELFKKCTVFFSPAFESMSNKLLAERILQNSLPVRLQLQLHKYIWNPRERGV